ncbi:MAG: hypothetical protein A2319_04285 [Candidatus Kerfeldbacteria bacterium RIFOXYB2_FULL_38_14]|uniref:Uncharacterized protein n=1 Tax=Candidatus Kerfeldbacteria bacterium RIFOXYB2_FULL_38_14 TaxID=1798547 RepID=A0A1G2BH75_9BACT|nr:MAG: hypothetical protein A2319_04285 [Candidatus Kerfeldbacteria bacterium RIFOXYB2_FULL_38_14]
MVWAGAVSATEKTQWQQQTVYSSNFNAGQYLQKEKDSAGVMHVVFYESETHKLYYTKSADGGTTWSAASIIDSRDGAGVKVQLTVDGQNRPLVTYLRRGNNAFDVVEYAYLANGTWVKATVARDDADPYAGNSLDAPTVFVDNNNIVHVFYKPDQGVHTYFIDAKLQADGTWSKTTVETNAGVCTSISDWQGIDSVYNSQTQKAHVAFKCTGVGTGTGLYIATLSSQGWSVSRETADYPGDGQIISMIVEKNGTVGILHNDTTISYNLYYTFLPTGSTVWSTSVIASEVALGYSDMAVDALGNIHIAYTADGGKLYYMQATSAGLSSQLVTYIDPTFLPKVGEVGIAVNAQNIPVITFAGDRVVYSAVPAVAVPDDNDQKETDDTGNQENNEQNNNNSEEQETNNTDNQETENNNEDTNGQELEEQPAPESESAEDTIFSVATLKVKNIKQKKLKISWQALDGAVSYQAVVYKKINKKYKSVKKYTTTATKIKVDKKYRKKINKKFYVRVRAVDEQGNISLWSKRIRIR